MPESTPYYAKLPYKLYLNDQFYGEGCTNVFPVFSLSPSSNYRLQIRFREAGACQIQFSTPPESRCLVPEGCVPDGITDCTAALQAAIDACPPGGTLYLPKGIYLSYPLFLHGHMMLYLEKGAVLLAGTQRDRYPVLPAYRKDKNGKNRPFASWEGIPQDSYASLLTMFDGEDIIIAGEGIIDANAQQGDWWENPKVKRGAWRPRTVYCAAVTGLTLLGVTLQNSPAWTLHPFYCSWIDVLCVHIQNPPDSPNTDGCDPESCENVRILGTEISVGDDCISVKSGKRDLALTDPRPSRNVLIRNCLLQRGHGAVVVGSETASGIDGLTICHCLMRNTDRGLRIKTRRGRGNTSILDRITMEKTLMESVLTPFAVNMFYFCDADGHSDYVRSKAPLPVTDETPEIRRIRCQEIQCKGARYAGLFLYGLPEQPIDSFVLKDVQIEFSQDPEKGMPVMMDDIEPVNRLALFAANVHQLLLENVRFTGSQGDCCQLHHVQEFICTDDSFSNQETSPGNGR